MPHPSFTRAARTLAVAAALCVWPGDALAAEPVRLLVELPPDLQVIGPGDTVPLQVVGEDAAGRRSSFGRRKVVFSVGRGRVTVVERPYSFRYHAPDNVNSAQSVRIKAHLEETPNVRGSVAVRLAPPGKYVRLILRPAATSVRLGAETTVEVLAEKREGGTTPLVDERVNVAVSGGGSIEFQRLGHYRFRAPTRAAGGTPGQRVKLTATLQNRAHVKGETTITLLGRRQLPPGPPPPDEPPADSVTKPPVEPDPGTVTDPGKTAPAEGAAGVLWPSGNIRVAVWRLKETFGAELSAPVKRLPAAGGEFVAQTAFQKLRVHIERNDVVKVELEWWVGDKRGARIRRDGPGGEGALTVVRNKEGKYVAHITGRTPDNHKPLHIDLLLTLSSGKVLREGLVMRRGRDRNRDGERDGGKRR